MIENVFSQIIPLTAAMALPFPVIKATRYLLGGKPLAHSLLFISIGVRRLKQGLEKNDDSVGSQSIEISAASIILSTIRQELFQLKNGLLFFFIIYLLWKSQLRVVQSFIASGVIAITAMIWASMPLFVYFLTGGNRDRVLELLKEWLMRNGYTLIIFICIFIGISTLSAGIGEMIKSTITTLLLICCRNFARLWLISMGVIQYNLIDHLISFHGTDRIHATPV